ncbi:MULTISPECIES: hypothetical protein [Thermomonosporaceae]|uniref:hypothetical protein n=1 Tax=Thermomonosporaceae TaxID=2012 RepID=UPI00255B0FBF|nr:MULTISPECIES: hypothetical protein [Thermomonosporaceae]MDL4771468.1 hypothetical protein [Actinomadura xylanilytica]
MRIRPNRAETRASRPEPRRREGPDIEPQPVISTRALVILLAAAVAAIVAALFPDAAIPIGVGVGVLTLLAQIVRD